MDDDRSKRSIRYSNKSMTFYLIFIFPTQKNIHIHERSYCQSYTYIHIRKKSKHGKCRHSTEKKRIIMLHYEEVHQEHAVHSV
jgi:hypothetical protein